MRGRKPTTPPRKPIYSIRDISGIFHVPVPTLHHWLASPDAPEPIARPSANTMGRVSPSGMTRQFYHLSDVKAFIDTHHADYKPKGAH